MRDFKLMSEQELIAVKGFAEALAERARFASNDAQGSLSDPDDARQEEWIREAQDAARAYAKAKSEGKRSRSYNQETELQREGVQSALSWLERRRTSKIRK